MIRKRIVVAVLIFYWEALIHKAFLYLESGWIFFRLHEKDF